MNQRSLRIDVLQKGDWRCSDADAVIFIDVFLTTTCLVTAASQQRRVLVTADKDHLVFNQKAAAEGALSS